jgi:hypothetical protein
MTTPGKAKLIADETSRDLDAGLDKVHAEGERDGTTDEAHAERTAEPAKQRTVADDPHQ